MRELPPSLELVFIAMLINLSISLPLGLLTARYAGSRFDDLVRLLVLAGAGLPVFWLAISCSRWSRGDWQLLPTAAGSASEPRIRRRDGLHLFDSSRRGRLDVFADALAHLVLPAFALSLLFTAVGCASPAPR